MGKAAGENKVPRLERILTLAVYYLILLFAVIAALEALGLTMVTQPLNALLNAIFAYIPSLIAGGVVIFIAWLVATILRAIVRGFLEATKMDKRVGEAADLKDWPLARAVGEVVYWLVWLLFLPIIFAAFGLTALIAPVMNLLGRAVGLDSQSDRGGADRDRGLVHRPHRAAHRGQFLRRAGHRQACRTASGCRSTWAR